MSHPNRPLKTVNCCAPSEQPHNATYVCGTCGEAEGMGPDDPCWNLGQFDCEYSGAEEHPTLTCRTCGHSDVTCYLEPEE